MIKYTKNVVWLEDYVNSVSDLVPIEQIKRVIGYKVKIGLNECQDAAIQTANKRGDKFVISIKLYEQEILKHKPIHIAFVLDSLAHELAHLMYWEHDSHHFKLQARILFRFGMMLKKKNINDTSKPFTKYGK